MYHFEAGVSGSLEAFSGSASLSVIFSGSEVALGINTLYSGGLNNSSGLRIPSLSLFGEMNLFDYRSTDLLSTSLEPYRGQGLNSNVTLGPIA